MVLVHDTSAKCALQMYEVSMKYLKPLSSYRADTILRRTERWMDRQREKNNMSPEPSSGRHSDTKCLLGRQKRVVPGLDLAIVSRPDRVQAANLSTSLCVCLFVCVCLSVRLSVLEPTFPLLKTRLVSESQFHICLA